jgi:hypothetical protein
VLDSLVRCACADGLAQGDGEFEHMVIRADGSATLTHKNSRWDFDDMAALAAWLVEAAAAHRQPILSHV